MEPNSKSGFNELIQAASVGDMGTVSFLIETGADLEARDSLGCTALMHAVQHQHIKVIEYLVDAGADIEAKDATGNTPLKYATHLNDPELLQLLTDPESRDDEVWEPRHMSRKQVFHRRLGLLGLSMMALLMLYGIYGLRIALLNRASRSVMEAIGTNDSVAVNTMLEKGMDPNIADGEGVSALLAAANNGRIEIVRLLLHHQADPNLGTPEGIVALKRMGMYHPDIVEALLVAGADPNRQDSKQKTLLSYAANSASTVPVVRLLLKYKARPNVTGENGPPLVSLIETGAPNIHDVVSTMLDNHADPNAVDSAGTPILIWVTERSDSDLMTLLLSKGANVDARDKYARTALLVAAKLERFDLVNKLLQSGANTSAADEDGENCLMYALAGMIDRDRNSMRDCADILRTLIAGGADRNADDHQGHTPLQFALLHQFPELATTLRSMGAKE